MRSFVIKDYLGFTCLADNCEDTCCTGWRITVPKEDYQRFQKLEPDSLREDILLNLSLKGNSYYFQNKADGRCSMLLDNGLCRIQKETSEKELCYTCRKYPRLFFSIPEEENSVCVSMAASCPVIAHTIVTGEITIFQIVDGKAHSFPDWKKEKPWVDLWSRYHVNEGVAKEYLLQKSNEQALYDGMRFLAAEIFSAFEQSNEDCVTRLLEALFPLVQSDDQACFEAFLSYLPISKKLWFRMKTNYVAYRIFSKGAEGVTDISQVLVQIQGELLLIQSLVFSQMMQTKTVDKISSKDWERGVRVMYRNCAHGKKTMQKINSIFQHMFHREVLWNFILQ